MKKLFLFFVLVSGLSFGQFTVSSSSDWQPIGEYYNSLYTYRNGDKIKFVYDDQRERNASFGRSMARGTGMADAAARGVAGNGYTKYEFIFSADPDTLEKIYSIVKEHFDSKQKEIVTLTFPEGNLYLDFKRFFGVYGVSFGTDQGNYKPWSILTTLGGVEKAFGLNSKSKK